jgi:uncharacterized protein YecT (DUF1311 family)
MTFRSSRAEAGAIVFSLTIFAGAIPRAQAQTESASKEDFERADGELNATYNEVLKTLPAAARERLRAAERAWISFTEKNAPALQALGKKRGLSQEELRGFNRAEVLARREQLEQMVLEPVGGDREKLRAQLERADGELNAAYRECVAQLEGDDLERLRAAQRAWITFRDEHSRANGNEPTAALLAVTARRAAELREFYLTEAPRRTSEPTKPALAHGTSEKADKNIPDPFERAR